MRTGQVVVDRNLVCAPIETYGGTRRLTNLTITALTTIGHEAAHARGVRSERTAECAGIRFAYRWMKSHGTLLEYDAAGVVADLMDDSNRPPAYKLRGTCSL